MNVSRLVVAASSMILVVAVSSAQTTNEPLTGLTNNPTYEKNCAKCHGKNATGRRFGGPSLASDKVQGLSDDEVRNFIANGKGKMPKYDGKLTKDQIGDAVKYIRTLKH